MRTKATLAGLLQGFFTGRLIGQRRVSPHTVASYRDTFRLLLRFARGRLKKEPAKLGLAEVDAPLLVAFLDHLEKERGNSARSRNARLAAVHSFFRYVALQEPEHVAQAQRILAGPSTTCRARRSKRCWGPPTRGRTWAGATPPCCGWRSRPG